METTLKRKRNKAVPRLRVITPTRTLVYALLLTLLVFAGANHSSGQAEKKSEKNKEEKELIARCKSKLIRNGRPTKPKNWEWGKGEKYRGAPEISYSVQEDGKIANVKLKRGSGVRQIDEYALEWVKGRKYQAMPGCPGIEITETVIIDFGPTERDEKR